MTILKWAVNCFTLNSSKIQIKSGFPRKKVESAKTLRKNAQFLANLTKNAGF